MIEYAIWGGVGGLLSILSKNGCIELPKVRDRKLYLGGLQGILFGIVAGIIGDTSPVNAFFWGAGSSAMLAGVVQFAERKFSGGVMPLGVETDLPIPRPPDAATTSSADAATDEEKPNESSN